MQYLNSRALALQIAKQTDVKSLTPSVPDLAPPEDLSAVSYSFRRPDPHVVSLLHARDLLKKAWQQYGRIIEEVRSGALPIKNLPLRQQFGEFFAGALPTGNEALLLLELSRHNEEQLVLGRRIGIEKSYRTRLARVFLDLATECNAKNPDCFIREVKSLNAALLVHQWTEQMSAWLKAPNFEPLPHTVHNIPRALLQGNPHISDRLFSALLRRSAAGTDGNCLLTLAPFREQEFLGFEIASNGVRAGRFITTVLDSYSNKVRHLRHGPVDRFPRLLPRALDSVGGASGEFTRFAVGAGPVDYDLAFGRRCIVQGNQRFIDLFSRVTTQVPKRVTIPAYATNQNYTHVAPVLSKPTISHFVRNPDCLVGASFWLKAFSSESSSPHSGELVVTVTIKSLSPDALLFDAAPTGAAARTSNLGVRATLGTKLRAYLLTGEGDCPHYSPIKVISSRESDRAPRVQFAGQTFDLPRSFQGHEVVPQIVEDSPGSRLLCFFERMTSKRTKPFAKLVLAINPETMRLERQQRE